MVMTKAFNFQVSNTGRTVALDLECGHTKRVKASSLNGVEVFQVLHRCRKCPTLATTKQRELFRRIVDATWNAATESDAVPSTEWADRIIDKVLSSAS
jgi:hypothetical protein